MSTTPHNSQSGPLGSCWERYTAPPLRISPYHKNNFCHHHMAILNYRVQDAGLLSCVQIPPFSVPSRPGLANESALTTAYYWRPIAAVSTDRVARPRLKRATSNFAVELADLLPVSNSRWILKNLANYITTHRKTVRLNFNNWGPLHAHNVLPPDLIKLEENWSNVSLQYTLKYLTP